MNHIKVYQPEDYAKLLDFFETVDSDYDPPLSHRDVGITGFVNFLTNHNGTAIISEDNGKITGSLGYTEMPGLFYIYWFSVLDEFKGTKLPFRLISHAFENDPGLRVTKGYTRSSEHNSRIQKLIEYLGGERVDDSRASRLENMLDKPIPGRVSHWYEVQGEKVYQKIRYLD